PAPASQRAIVTPDLVFIHAAPCVPLARALSEDGKLRSSAPTSARRPPPPQRSLVVPPSLRDNPRGARGTRARTDPSSLRTMPRPKASALFLILSVPFLSRE